MPSAEWARYKHKSQPNCKRAGLLRATRELWSATQCKKKSRVIRITTFLTSIGDCWSPNTVAARNQTQCLAETRQPHETQHIRIWSTPGAWLLYREWLCLISPYVFHATFDQLFSLLQRNLKTAWVRIELTMLSSTDYSGARVLLKKLHTHLAV